MAAVWPPLSEWMNGERGVVLLFIARIIYAAPRNLIVESMSLCILSVFALLLDISVDGYSRSSASSVGNPLSDLFKTRPGVSSGILLGAATLPGLMLSRLIQMLRGVSLNEVGISEVEYLQLQYWVASASCFSILVFLFLILRQKGSSIQSSGSSTDWSTSFSLSCVAFYGGLCCIAARSSFGWHMALTLLWVVFHGFAARKLIQNILHRFPACASIGEALLVTAGLVIYFGDMFAYTVTKILGYVASPRFTSIPYDTKRSEISTIIQGMILGLLLFPTFLDFIFRFTGFLKFLDVSRDRANHEIRISTIFYAALLFMLIVIVPSWMQLVQDFHGHPFLWVLDFVFSEPLKRLSLCIYWVALIAASVTRFYAISKNSKIERILLRKYYHLLAVLMFIPALIIQPKFLHLAFGAALGVFLTLEIIRNLLVNGFGVTNIIVSAQIVDGVYLGMKGSACHFPSQQTPPLQVWRIWPLGQVIHQFMNAFTDHRDSEILIVSHFSLLLGCSLPIWLSSGFNDRPLSPFAGILSLGIGDTMASMVGHKYGVLRWSKSGKKTIEGTAAGITSVLAACSVLLPLLAITTGYILTWNWFSLIMAVITSGLLEAYTAQLDNAFIPLVFYSLLCL